MKNLLWIVAVGSLLVLFICFSTSGQSTAGSKKKETLVTNHAIGTFEVKATPLPAEDGVGDPLIGRLSLDKTYSGGLSGVSKGQMLGIGTAVKESAGYVAAERFIGTLDGKKGSFSLQHSGIMQGGKFDLNVTVVPDSGTDELTGISGKLVIKIEGGKHFYELEYKLPTSK